jgi:hypothetical protein
MDNRQFARFFVETMVNKRFMAGWFGDSSEVFIQEQTDVWSSIFDGTLQAHINTVSGAASNLHLYCGWSWKQIEEFIQRSGFVLFQYKSASGDAYAMAKEEPSSQILEQTQDWSRQPNWRPVWKKK